MISPPIGGQAKIFILPPTLKKFLGHCSGRQKSLATPLGDNIAFRLQRFETVASNPPLSATLSLISLYLSGLSGITA